MDEDNWLLCGYKLGTNLKNPKILPENLPKLKKSQAHWLHLNLKHPNTKKWLEEESGLNPLVVEALLANETRPRVTDIADGTLVILRGVNLNDNAEPEDMVSLRLFINDARIISVRRRSLKTVINITSLFEKHQGPKNTGEFLSILITHLTKNISPSISHLIDQVDHIEEDLVDGGDLPQRQILSDLRRQTIIFKRYLSPMREAFAALRNGQYSWLSKHHIHHIQENYDHITRFIEDLDEIRERLQITHDELKNSISDRLNHNMYMLSVVAAIFLPLGFLTGLLGVNLGGIPGADSPIGFYAFIGILITTLSCQMLLFKKLKWL